MANGAANMANVANTVANPVRDDAGCYMRYRDPKARREYMRVYMANRRKKNASKATP
jgi:hypothetical protein